MTNLGSVLESRDITLRKKAHLVKAKAFPSYVWMWELDYKESWALKTRCFWTVVLEKPFFFFSVPLMTFFFFFIFFQFIYFNWRLITLQYCSGLPHIDMNLPWVYMCFPSWAPLPPPSPYHPSGSSQCTNPNPMVSYLLKISASWY